MNVPDTVPDNEVFDVTKDHVEEINPRTGQPYKTPRLLREKNKFSKLRKREENTEAYVLKARAYMRTYQAKRYNKNRLNKKLSEIAQGIPCFCVCCQLQELKDKQHNISPLSSNTNSSNENSDADST